MSLYAADGSWNVTVVDGNTYTGLYAPDGSYNVVEVDGTSIAGLYAPCGAYNVYVSDGTYIGFYHPSGAINVSVSPYETGTVRVTAVSGDLGNDPLAPDAPVLIRTSLDGSSEPTFDHELDGTKLWGVGEIDGSNFDQIQTRVATDAGFTSIEDTNTYTILEADLGDFVFDTSLGPLTAGLKYFQSRHNHHVAGVDHWSAWSNTLSDTVVSNSGEWDTNFWWR